MDKLISRIKREILTQIKQLLPICQGDHITYFTAVVKLVCVLLAEETNYKNASKQASIVRRTKFSSIQNLFPQNTSFALGEVSKLT